MTHIKDIIIKRIELIDEDMLLNTINKLKYYNVNLFNDQGQLDYENFRNSYFKTYDLLFETDIPVNGIRYQLCDFMSAVQVIVGIRNFNRFIVGK